MQNRLLMDLGNCANSLPIIIITSHMRIKILIFSRIIHPWFTQCSPIILPSVNCMVRFCLSVTLSCRALLFIWGHFDDFVHRQSPIFFNLAARLLFPGARYRSFNFGPENCNSTEALWGPLKHGALPHRLQDNTALMRNIYVCVRCY